MAVGVFVPLSAEAKARLLELSRREKRQPHCQAALIIERALAEEATEKTKAQHAGSAA